MLISKKADVDNEYIDKEIEYRIQFFENWKKINPQTKIITTDKASHFIHLDEPSLVIDEINELIVKVRSKM